MDRNTSFSFVRSLSGFVEAQVQEAHLPALRDALVDGEHSGCPTPFDFEAFIATRKAISAPEV